jgi:hypothetical protein
VVVLTREAEVLRQVPLADDHNPDPRSLLFSAASYRARTSAHMIATRILPTVERPPIGAGIIFLLR